MDLHELALRRSLAFHREIARRILDDPAVLERARQRVKQWLAENPERPHVRAWDEILSEDAGSVAAFLVESSERAEELRQSSPFAGVLNARERWAIWRDTRQKLAEQE